MIIKILGAGCANCKTLERRVNDVVAKHQINAQVEKVTDLQEIMTYGIMRKPGLVIEGVVKSVGVIPKDEQILDWLLEKQS